MEYPDYCLRCFEDVKKWEEIIVTAQMLVVRCPYCRTLHTFYADGTVRLH